MAAIDVDYLTVEEKAEYAALLSVADTVRAELPHLEKVVRDLVRQGLYTGVLPGIYRELRDALDALDKEINDEK